MFPIQYQFESFLFPFAEEEVDRVVSAAVLSLLQRAPWRIRAERVPWLAFELILYEDKSVEM